MNDDKAKSIFLAATLELTTEARAAYIKKACGGDANLRARVEALLAAHDAASGFMRSNAGDAPNLGDVGDALDPDMAGDTRVPAERVGDRIGQYKLLERIGEGGFGRVFMAEQQRPVSRRVALKVIKPGMDSRMVAARFEAERQALALMDHPHIARVFDGGVTDASLGSRPYFVMEYVKGDPITRFADAHKLSLRERLDLFTQVCHAVQHAHTKGVIHRDIKPSNVLVSMTDGRPFAKVIDFGIAKSLASPLTEKTLFTAHAQLIGTPEYMSPEQAEGSPDIDTRTDVYALGVLLYELLTSSTPFEANRLRSAAFAEMQRIIKEEEPPAPSMRLSRDLSALASKAAARQIEPSKLSTQVKGELDWIVMKALDKDRARRYESASQFAQDVERHLDGEAVEAAPPSVGYRVRKFVRRNKGRVITAIAVAGALAIGLFIAATFFVRSERLSTRLALANAELADGREKEARAAQAEAEKQRVAIEQEREKATLAEYTARLKHVRDLLFQQTPRNDEALAELDACSPEHRGWEWDHLQRIFACQMIEYGPNDRAVRTCISPDGSLVAAFGTDNHIRMWDRASAKQLLDVPCDGLVSAMRFSDDQSTLYFASGRTVIGLSSKSGSEQVRLQAQGESVIAISAPSSDVLAVLLNDQTNQYGVECWNLGQAREGGELSSFQLPRLPANTSIAGGDFRDFYVADSTAYLVDRWAQRIALSTGQQLAASPTTLWQNVVHFGSQSMPRWCVDDERRWSAEVSASGRIIVGDQWQPTGAGFANEDSWMRIADTIQRMWPINQTEVLVETSGSVRLVDILYRQELNVFPDIETSSPITISNDKQSFCMGSANGQIIVHPMRSKAEPTSWQAHDEAVSAIAHGYRHVEFVSGSAGGEVAVWGKSRTEPIARFRTQGYVNAVAIDDSESLVSCIADPGVLSVWSRQTGQLLASSEIEPAYRLQFSPDGKLLLLSGGVRISLRDASTLKELSEAVLSNGNGEAIFLGNGDRIATVSGYRLTIWKTQGLVPLFDAPTDNSGLSILEPTLDGSGILAAGSPWLGLWSTRPFEEKLAQQERIRNTSRLLRRIAISRGVQPVAIPEFMERDGSVPSRYREEVMKYVASPEDLLDQYFPRYITKSRMLAAVASDAELSEDARNVLRVTLAGWSPSAYDLNRMSRIVLSKEEIEPAIMDAAVDAAREAVTLEPSNAAYLYTLAIALFRSGQYDESMESMQWVIEKVSRGEAELENAAAIYIGLLYLHQGRVADAQAIHDGISAMKKIKFLTGDELPEWLLTRFESELDAALRAKSMPAASP